MAQENIKEVAPIFSEKIGARLLVVGEVVFPKKYKTEGCELSEAQLQQLGLTDALVDCGWIVTSGKAAKNAAQIIAQFNITNPGPTKNEAQKVAIQAYESITTKNNKELGAESTESEEAKLIVALIGR